MIFIYGFPIEKKLLHVFALGVCITIPIFASWCKYYVLWHQYEPGKNKNLKLIKSENPLLLIKIEKKMWEKTQKIMIPSPYFFYKYKMKSGKISPHPTKKICKFLSVLVLVLLSAMVERFSVSRKRDLFHKGDNLMRFQLLTRRSSWSKKFILAFL